MKNKAFLKLFKKTSPNSNSGFTLMELLVGLFMSIFVVGALGFGMLQVLRITQSETSKSSARNETSRAIDFISDEIRRAKSIENVTTNINTSGGFNPTATGRIIVLALEIPEVSNNFGVDGNTATPERVVYYLDPASSTWRGDLVLHRYGPPLGNNGDYTTGSWGSVGKPLIDNITDDAITSECANTATTTPVITAGTPPTTTGFYACITETNTAQLYFTGLTKTVTGDNTDNYAANTQAVARVTDAPLNSTNTFSSYTWSFQDLGGAYNCSGADEWTIRTDFGNNSSNSDDTKKWIRDTNRQPQPIAIDSSKPLTITTSPIGKRGCSSRGNDYLWNGGLETTTPTSSTGKKADGTWEVLSEYDPDIKVDHTIDFNNPKTFNGDQYGGTYNTSIVKKNPDNTDNPTVQFLKKGTTIPHYGVFDSNNDGDLNDPGDQKSLGQFLYDKGYARLTSGTLNTTTARFEMISSIATTDASYPSNPKVLGDDQRIISFEVGHTSTTTDTGSANPGFDLQDNIFIVTSDVFKKKFASTCFNGGSCPAP
jgi:hypothetical protein